MDSKVVMPGSIGFVSGIVVTLLINLFFMSGMMGLLDIQPAPG